MNLSRLPKNLVVLVAETEARERHRLEIISSALTATLRIVKDGEEAVDYLSPCSIFHSGQLSFSGLANLQFTNATDGRSRTLALGGARF